MSLCDAVKWVDLPVRGGCYRRYLSDLPTWVLTWVVFSRTPSTPSHVHRITLAAHRLEFSACNAAVNSYMYYHFTCMHVKMPFRTFTLCRQSVQDCMNVHCVAQSFHITCTPADQWQWRHNMYSRSTVRCVLDHKFSKPFSTRRASEQFRLSLTHFLLPAWLWDECLSWASP